MFAKTKAAITASFIVGSVFGFPFTMALQDKEIIETVAYMPIPRTTFTVSLELGEFTQDKAEQSIETVAEHQGVPEKPVKQAPVQSQKQVQKRADSPPENSAKQLSAPVEVETVKSGKVKLAKLRRRSRAVAVHKVTAMADIATKAKKSRKKRRRSCLDESYEVKKVQKNRYALTRGLVDYYANHIKKAQDLANASWHKNKAGKVDGVRLRRVRCGSLLYESGLRNGDVVKSINGRKVKSLRTAVKSWMEVRRSRNDKFQVVVARGNKEVRLVYLVEDSI